MRLLFHSFLIVVAGGLLGLGLNARSGKPAPLGKPVFPVSASATATCGSGQEPGVGAPAVPADFPKISVTEAVSACSACSAGFVDARGAAAFAEGHIAGAVHLPPEKDPEEQAALAALRRFATVVVYDGGEECRLARAVARRLHLAGFTDVRLLDVTWDAWQARGGPAESGACGACGAHAGESHP